jgi:hypothetical protein
MTPTRLFTLTILALFALFALPALAQDAAATSSVQDAVSTFIAGLAAKYPVLVTIMFWIGVLKFSFKPIMTVIEGIVAATPSATDDAKLKAFESGTVYRWLVWGLDWFTGIKTPSALKAGTTNPLVSVTPTTPPAPQV